MESLSPAQIHYMRSVLGIDGIMFPPLSDDVSPMTGGEAEKTAATWRSRGDVAQAKFHLLIASDTHEFPLHPEADQLLSKMLQAMKLQTSEVAIFEWTLGGQSNCPTQVQALVRSSRSVLIMGENAARSLSDGKMPFGEMSQWSGRNAFLTYSPLELLSSPELKKPAWAHLQSFMKHL